MSLTKYADYRILAASTGVGRSYVSRLGRTAHRAQFDYEKRSGYLYVRSRAISSRANLNSDLFPADEIKAAWRTFIGKPVFVNHANEDHRRARGVIIDAALHEDRNPNGTPDTWVEVLMEVDAIRFPKLAEAVISGNVDRTSMGVDVERSVCTKCGNVAYTPLEYCACIRYSKGQTFRKRTATGYDDIVIAERCEGLAFFENSLLVEEPADPTAAVLGVEGEGMMPKVAKVAAAQNLPKHTYSVTMPDGTKASRTTTRDYSHAVVVQMSAKDAQREPEWKEGDWYTISYHGNPAAAQRSVNKWGGYYDNLHVLPVDNPRTASLREAAPVMWEGHPEWSTGPNVKTCPRDGNQAVISMATDPGPDPHPIWNLACGHSVAEVDYRSGQLRIVPAPEAVPTLPSDIPGVQPPIPVSAHRRTASRRHGYGEATAPSEVDTLRQQACPVCGTESQAFNGSVCSVCGYTTPPEMMQPPDTGLAQKVDLRQDQQESQGGDSDITVSQDREALGPVGARRTTIQEVSPAPNNGLRGVGMKPALRQMLALNVQVEEQDKLLRAVAAKSGVSLIPYQRRVADRVRDLSAPLPAPAPSARQGRPRVRRADINNPAQPIPAPASEAASQTSQQAAAPDAKVDVTAPGGTPVTEGSATTVDVAAPGATPVTDTSAGTTQSVTAPVSGTETNTEGTVPVDVQVGTPTDEVAFPVTSAVSEPRLYAALRLARLRMEAGIAPRQDDLALANAISRNAKLSDGRIRDEITTLSSVMKVQASRPSTPAPAERQAPGRRTAARAVPSLAPTTASMGVSSVSDLEEPLW